ncbi:hypothetical protein DICPUDRAFT_151859 [Dictyostelium purpureum]|uniref:non-specific serine/threonine protein kinase n=1 Tax=Dictyostelium purpureum TaxID=5786 RepID=F0ZJY0_DICPU|nr:uncharacterized protein DICPUDRAFT_151859 [Dictyostelium purpureum]EGC35773.1 hypothetical protein DICPUDRAFT_151859 [Dictyostelium purpureum]|eukprot:XP_003287725.1 hypothetical protein DICPUDRAFT_151859 [Dictyostelium purpureum]
MDSTMTDIDNSSQNSNSNSNNNSENIEDVKSINGKNNNISTNVAKLEDIGTLISQGAEAKTFVIDLYGLKCIVKERFVKAYRHPTIDQKISSKRILQEVRSLNKCKKKGIDCPSLYLVDTKLNRIYMEFIEGETVKQFLYTNQSKSEQEERVLNVMNEIGKQISSIHDMGLVHGDLTTSNMLLRPNLNPLSEKDQLVFIDFGLSYVSNYVEDKAVDLYVLERAFISTHPNSEILFKNVLNSYEKNGPNPKEASIVIQKLNQVRLRGRKKLAFVEHNIQIDVKLLGFDSTEHEELERLLNSLNNKINPLILFPKIQTIDLIKQNIKYKVISGSNSLFKLNEDIKDRVKGYISDNKHKSTLDPQCSVAPYDVVDNLVYQDFKDGDHQSYTIYIINSIFDRDDTHYKYTYSQMNSESIRELHNALNVIDHLCNVKMWQSKSENSSGNKGEGRYIWIDIGADSSEYGPHTKGTGLVTNEQLPQFYTKFTKKLYDISTFVYHTTKQLIATPIYQIPQEYGWRDLEIQLIMIHDHMVGLEEKSDLFDWDLIQKELSKIPLASGQKISFIKKEISMLNDLYASQTKLASLKTHHSALKGTQQYLDSKELHYWFKKHINRFIPEYQKDSLKTIIPIFLFDISYKEYLLLDRYHQSISFPDMVIATQTQGGLLKIDYQCDRQLAINSADATKPALQSLLSTVWGITPSHMVAHRDSRSIENNYVWSIGYNPSNMFTNHKELSFSQTDAAIRNLIYIDIISSIESLKSIVDHIGDDETWEEFTRSNPEITTIDQFFRNINSTIAEISNHLTLHKNQEAFKKIEKLQDLSNSMSQVIHKIHSTKHSYLECEKPTFLLPEFLSIVFTTTVIIYFLYKVILKSINL